MLHVSNKGNITDLGAIFPRDVTSRKELSQKLDEAKAAEAQKAQAAKDVQEVLYLRGILSGPHAQVLRASNNLDASFDGAKVALLCIFNDTNNNNVLAFDTGWGGGEKPWALSYGPSNVWQRVMLMKDDPNNKDSLWRIQSLSDVSQKDAGPHYLWAQDTNLYFSRREEQTDQNYGLWVFTRVQKNRPGWYCIVNSMSKKYLGVGDAVNYGSFNGRCVVMEDQKNATTQYWSIYQKSDN